MLSRLGVLAAMIAARPAAGGEYARSGALEWFYQDMSVRAPSGTRHVSSWNQAYDLSIFGPLGHEIVGEGTESISFQQGHTLSQLASSGDSRQNVLGYSLAWSLLPELVRRYVRLNPALSRTRSNLAWGQPVQARSLVDTSRSIDLGLSFPKLPTLTVKRSLMARKDESGAPVIDQSNAQGTEEAGYVRGPFYARYLHDRSSTDDRLAGGGRSVADQTNAEANLSFFGLKHGLDNAFVRTTYEAQTSAFNSLVRTRRRNSAETASLTSQHWSSGHWTSYLFTTETFSRDFAAAENLKQGSLALNSVRNTPSGHLNNSLRYSRSGGLSDAENVLDSLYLDQRFKRALYHVDGNGGWAWTPADGALLSDSLLQRLTFGVVRRGTVFLEQGTSGATPMSGRPGGRRTNFAGLGSDLTRDSLLTFSSHYRAERSADLGTGTRSVRHNVISEAHLTPTPEVKSSLVHNIAWNEGPAGVPARVQYLTSTFDYVGEPWTASAGYTSDCVTAYDAFLEAEYRIGKTGVQLRLERKGLVGPIPYWLWSVRLRRIL